MEEPVGGDLLHHLGNLLHHLKESALHPHPMSKVWKTLLLPTLGGSLKALYGMIVAPPYGAGHVT